MNSAATDPLLYDRAAELDERQVPAAGKKWSRRRTTVFVFCGSTLFWTLIVLGVRGIL